AHDFVADEENAVAVADVAKTLDVTIGRNDDPVRTGHGLDEHRGDGVRPFVHEDLFDLVEAAPREHGVTVTLSIEMAAVFVGIEESNHARDARLVRPAP